MSVEGCASLSLISDLCLLVLNGRHCFTQMQTRLQCQGVLAQHLVVQSPSQASFAQVTDSSKRRPHINSGRQVSQEDLQNMFIFPSLNKEPVLHSSKLSSVFFVLEGTVIVCK